MKNGICPKCGSAEVYAGVDLAFKSGADGSNCIPITSWSSAALDNYVCADCGYLESYISDRAKLRKIAKHWPRAQPHPYTSTTVKLEQANLDRKQHCPNCDIILFGEQGVCPTCGWTAD